MNNRIKELAEQAGMALKPRRLYDDNEPDGYLESDDDYFKYNLEATRVFFEGGLEKFAKLIVRECMDVAKDYTPDTEECEYTWLIHNKIEQHFGVEE